MALAGAGRAEDALEIQAMAVAHGEEMGTGVGALSETVDPEPFREAREELHEDVAAAAIARGRAVPLERRMDRVRALVSEPRAATRER